MFSNQKMVILFDCNSLINEETGDLTISIASVRKIIGNLKLVGIQTQQLAQIQSMNFQYSIVIDRMYYNNQKYLYMENQLYNIGNISPAQLEKDCKLNISKFEDSNIRNAIEGWLNYGSI